LWGFVAIGTGPALNEKLVITHSDYLLVTAEVADALSLTTTLADVNGLAPAAIACIQSIGIWFVHMEGERYVSFTKDVLMVRDAY